VAPATSNNGTAASATSTTTYYYHQPMSSTFESGQQRFPRSHSPALVGAACFGAVASSVPHSLTAPDRMPVSKQKRAAATATACLNVGLGRAFLKTWRPTRPSSGACERASWWALLHGCEGPAASRTGGHPQPRQKTGTNERLLAIRSSGSTEDCGWQPE
jgi:hypothetical protein